MRAVLISINPKWCKLIIDGKKTVEIRKTRPKIDTPFKCYIYCTRSGAKEFFMDIQNGVDKWYKEKWSDKSGKVIGEFVCDKIIEDHTVGHNAALYRDAACLPVGEAAAYCTQFPMYGWHISDLKIYDTPKELSEFSLNRPPQSWRYVEEMKEAK